MLKDIGVKLDINAVPSDDFFDKYVIPGNFDIMPFSLARHAVPDLRRQ